VTSSAVGHRSTTGETVSARRSEILAIAAEVFREKGILKATVRDIAQRAGILSGSLYHHFESKEQIIEEILTTTGEPLLERCREIVATNEDSADALHLCITAAVRYVATAPNEAAILRNDSRAIATIPRLAFVQQRRDEMRDLWISIVKRGQRNGVFRLEADPLLSVSAMWDAVLSSARWLPPDGHSSVRRVAEQLGSLFTSGLSAH
jgi:AcrR family transcriptional regulator